MIIPIGDENPTTRAPIVTVSVMVLCGLVFLVQLGMSGREAELFALRYGMVPLRIFGKIAEGKLPAGIPAWATIFSSMFMHGGLMHLVGNMLFLWICGNNVEDRLGHGRYLAFYLACGVAAALVQGISDPRSPVPMIGASGAISGVLAAYLVLFPHARIIMLAWVAVFRVRAMFAIGGWFVFQIFNALAADPGEGGVAWYAHIGGFLAGLALVLVLRPREPEPAAAGPWTIRRGRWG